MQWIQERMGVQENPEKWFLGIAEKAGEFTARVHLFEKGNCFFVAV